MTLYRQMSMITTTLMVLLLGTVIAVTFSHTIETLETQLYEDAQNTASSLSLSLGSTDGSESVMSTMINANFDTGHYARIILYDMEKKIVYERIGEEVDHGVPEWFKALITIKIPKASAQVSSGWTPIGVLKVQSDSSYAYGALYTQLFRLIILFVLLVIIGLGMLYYALHLVLRPLIKVRQQAEAIMRNEFIHQKEIPSTTEFRDVVTAMNSMVTKVHDIFDSSDKAMHHNHELLYRDSLTGLHNRRYLMMRFHEYLGAESAYEHGTLTLFALHGALEANQVIGHQNVDQLFIKIAKTVETKGQHVNNSIAARVNGTEFMLLLPGCLGNEGVKIALRIIRSVQKSLLDQGLTDKGTFNITAGITGYTREDDVVRILSGADYALSQANHHKDEQIYLHTDQKESTVKGKEAWRTMITDAIEERRFTLGLSSVYDTVGKREHHKEIGFDMRDADGELHNYGEFIAPVITLGLLSDVYMDILSQVLRLSEADTNGARCTFRLPAELLSTPNITLALEPLLEAHADSLQIDLVFGIHERFIAANTELAKTFIALFKRFGFDIGIYQFTGESQENDYLKTLRPAYIKADVSYLLDQDQQSMSSIQIIIESLGVNLIATNVSEPRQLEMLAQHKIHIIQGPVVDQIA